MLSLKTCDIPVVARKADDLSSAFPRPFFALLFDQFFIVATRMRFQRTDQGIVGGPFGGSSDHTRW